MDNIILSLINKIQSRSVKGIEKYKTTLAENDKDDYLNHLQEELTDGAAYIEKLLTLPSYENLQNKVILWAQQKQLTNSDKQLSKIGEEFGEVCGAYLKNDKENLQNEIGDLMVTLIIFANQNGYNPIKCLEKAYKKIENRNGSTVNGTFIKL